MEHDLLFEINVGAEGGGWSEARSCHQKIDRVRRGKHDDR